MKILFVDDDQGFLDTRTELLERNSHEVVRFTDGQSALIEVFVTGNLLG
jgi:DNA-binding response OmpR family regulator